MSDDELREHYEALMEELNRRKLHAKTPDQGRHNSVQFAHVEEAYFRFQLTCPPEVSGQQEPPPRLIHSEQLVGAHSTP
jgi:hypothetical protein